MGPGVQSLLPSNTLDRARVSQIVNIIQCDIHPLQNLGMINNAIDDFGMPDVGKDRRPHPFRMHFLRRGLTALDSIMSETSARFAVGDVLTLADVYLVPQVRNALGAGIDVEAEFPVVHRIWATCL